MTPPRLSATLAGHLSRALASFKEATEALRSAASVARVESIAGVDPVALETFASVTDANRGGIERMTEKVKHAGGHRP